MPHSADYDLIKSIRDGDEQSWAQLIQQYEGRLTAFARKRITNPHTVEDLVQETFIGFLTSLPNYKPDQTPVESFLFRILAYKLTDHFRKQGGRQLQSLGESSRPGSARVASSIARSQEQRVTQRDLIQATLAPLVHSWKTNGDYERLKCLELLFVRGVSNKDAASTLNITEQQVANHKQFLVQKLKQVGLHQE